MLQTRTSDNLVVAATHGRGLFTSDVFMQPNADFAAAPLIAYTNKPIQFSDGSSAAVAWSWDFGDGTTSPLKNPSHSYAAPGLYTVMLTINNNASFRKTRTSYVQVLPNKGSPYLIANGDAGNFELATIDFGAENTAGTPFELGNSAIANKNGTASGAKAWVTGLAVSTYLDNSFSALYCPNFNLTAAGTYTLSFYGSGNSKKITTASGLNILLIRVRPGISWAATTRPAGITSTIRRLLRRSLLTSPTFPIRRKARRRLPSIR
jgi:PKD repeat protein